MSLSSFANVTSKVKVRMASKYSEDLAVSGLLELGHEGISRQDVSHMKNSRSGYLSWLTRLYNEVERLMGDSGRVEEVLLKKDLINTTFSRFEDIHFSMLALLPDHEERKSFEDSFAVQVERRQNFMSRIELWIDREAFRSTPPVEPEDSISQAASLISIKGRPNSKLSKSSKSLASINSQASSTSSARLREAKERRELAHLKLQQLKLTQELEQRRAQLENEAQRLKLIHEFELATASEKVWSAPVFDPVALDAPQGSLGSSRQGPGGPEGFPRSGPAPTPSATSEPVRQTISSPVESVVTKSHSLNPLAAGWSSRLPTSPVSSAPQPSHADQNESKVEDLVRTLVSALDVGFNIPRAEILTFDGDPLEYCQFIHNFDVNIASLISDPRKRLAYLIQYCRGEAKQVIENCCMYESERGYKKAREILYHQFGRPHIVAQAHVNQLTKGQMIKPTDGSALQKLARQMLKCEITLSQTGYDADLNNSETLLKIMDRLPPRLQTKWAERAENIFCDGGRPCFSDLTAFIQRTADIASNMFGLRLNVNSSRDRSSNRPQQRNRNDTPRRGTTLAVRSVNAPESSHESPREIRNNVVVHPRNVSD